MAEPIQQTTGQGTASNVQLYDAGGNPIALVSGGIPVFIMGSGSMVWPLVIDFLTVEPSPVAGRVLFYALSDGVASPNNVVSLRYLFPDGQKVILQEMTI